jgi:hypothetical protein
VGQGGHGKRSQKGSRKTEKGAVKEEERDSCNSGHQFPMPYLSRRVCIKVRDGASAQKGLKLSHLITYERLFFLSMGRGSMYRCTNIGTDGMNIHNSTCDVMRGLPPPWGRCKKIRNVETTGAGVVTQISRGTLQ